MPSRHNASNDGGNDGGNPRRDAALHVTPQRLAPGMEIAPLPVLGELF
jgi:hypothetical protein